MTELKKDYGAKLFGYVMFFSMPFPLACRTEMMGLYSCSPSIFPMLDAWRFAHCCALHNAHGAIFLGSLASELADSLCVDYLAQVTTPRLSMTVAVAVAIEEASK